MRHDFQAFHRPIDMFAWPDPVRAFAVRVRRYPFDVRPRLWFVFVRLPLIGWLAMYLSMEVPISATGQTWRAFRPLSDITISMRKWSLQARKAPL